MPAERNVIDTMLALSGDEPAASAPLTPFEHAFGEFQPDYQRWDQLYWGWFDNAEAIWPVGRVKVTVKLVRDIRAPKAAGKHGARLTDRGKKPSEVKIEVYLWRRDHFAAFTITCEKYAALKSIEATQHAIKIKHPETVRAKINEVVVKSIEMPEIENTFGMFKATMNCVEFIPPPKRNAAGHTQTVIQLPASRIDRLGQTNRAPVEANRSVAPATPRDTEGVPASGIPQPIASGL